MNEFSELGLNAALLVGVESLGYTQLTPVQAVSLPHILAGRDVIAQARTGSGKTAAFGLGLLGRLDANLISTQALVLCPTRELADQLSKDLRALARGIPNVKVLSLCGGIPLRPQLASLKHPPHVVVGTPGRIEELMEQKALDFSGLRTLVLDEADRMLDMGFSDSINHILGQLPKQRQTLLFSATLPPPIRTISKNIQQQAVTVTVDTEDLEHPLEQRLYEVDDARRGEALLSLLLVHRPAAALVFCNTRRLTQDVAELLASRRFPVQALHGELDQRDRDEVLVRFANRSRPLLIATDVAARGLDIKDLPLVVSLELAHDPDTHLHRIGRTARAGQQGLALALVSAADSPRLIALSGVLGADQRARPLDLSPARGASGPAAPMATLVIDAGRQDKLRPGDVVGALTGTTGDGLAVAEIGKIDSFATRTYVAVQRNQYQRAFERLDRGKIKGRSFRVRKLD